MLLNFSLQILFDERPGLVGVTSIKHAAELIVALVDYLGGIAEGRLKSGDNPVLMTMELVLEVL